MRADVTARWRLVVVDAAGARHVVPVVVDHLADYAMATATFAAQAHEGVAYYVTGDDDAWAVTEAVSCLVRALALGDPPGFVREVVPPGEMTGDERVAAARQAGVRVCVRRATAATGSAAAKEALACADAILRGGP